MKFFTKEVKIALVTVVAILIVYFGIMFLKNVKLSSAKNIFYVEMSDVNGLSPQAEVLANGMNVGLVKSLTFDAQRQMVIVAVDLNEGYQLPKGSTATLQKDMLGAPKMKLMLGALTYAVSILLTFGVLLLVGLMVARKNKKIDMVEALKGAE